jgi:GPH family glycoside/pentoside/hexuronide:cation symporter
VAFAYIFFGMSYTGTSMPFGAMANVVTVDPVERSKLSRARSVGGGLVGAVALGMVPVICYKDNQPIPERFTMLAVIFGICSIISYLLLCTLTKERVREVEVAGEKNQFFRHFFTSLKMVLKNRPLIGVMVATIGSMLVITGSSQTYGYIYKEVYGNAALATISMACSMPFMIVVFPLIPKMVKKFGKRDVILYTAALSFIFSVVRLFIYIENVWVYTALNIMTLLGQTAFTMLIWALVSDCLDYSEWKTGFRSDGSMYSMYTFSRKIGSTIASSGLAFSLGLVGYVSGENVVQTTEAVKGIYYICNAIPTICYGLILVGIGLIFNLDKKKTDQMYAEMAAKREGK